MGSKRSDVGEVTVHTEPEIQYWAHPATFPKIESWVLEEILTLGSVGVTRMAMETVVHSDTPGNRLFAKGMTLRTKELGGGLYRHDLKVPVDLKTLEVLPDKDGVIWRKEICYESASSVPDLGVIFASQATPVEVKKLLENIVGKQMESKFRAEFDKQKFRIPYENNKKSGVSEFNLQRGAVETMDGCHQTPQQHIVELELKKGDIELLGIARSRLNDTFREASGFGLLKERKAVQGYRLLYENGYMTQKGRERYEAGLKLHVPEELVVAAA